MHSGFNPIYPGHAVVCHAWLPSWPRGGHRSGMTCACTCTMKMHMHMHTSHTHIHMRMQLPTARPRRICSHNPAARRRKPRPQHRRLRRNRPPPTLATLPSPPPHRPPQWPPDRSPNRSCPVRAPPRRMPRTSHRLTPRRVPSPRVCPTMRRHSAPASALTAPATSAPHAGGFIFAVAKKISAGRAQLNFTNLFATAAGAGQRAAALRACPSYARQN